MCSRYSDLHGEQTIQSILPGNVYAELEFPSRSSLLWFSLGEFQDWGFPRT